MQPVPPAAESTLEGGSYDVIRRRLSEQAAELGSRAEALNKKRKELFGGRELALIATERVRTENNCVPRDVVSVGGQLLFGFQVFIGLKSETRVSDVLSLNRFAKVEDGYDLGAISPEGSFLSDPEFDKQFRDVFRYYPEARLLQLRRTDTRLLMAVQIGATSRDLKIFRFAIDAQGRVSFMDARGEEDYAPPRSHAFEWRQTTRDDQVSGPHPHINVLDEVFVETVGGDLTIKIENNTKDGQGVYREPVDDRNQTLDDADIAYAKVGGLILLKVKPFREETVRYLVYNTRTQHVLRVDAIGGACVELPEDHGIIFPGGYYLQSGEHKLFDKDHAGLRFERSIPSPNGEDVLFVFYREVEGEYLLLPYNLIAKEVQNPIRCHGYSLLADGTMLLFRASPAEEPTRVHPVQIWQTPFTTAEFAASAPTNGSYLGKVGNADIVACLSEVQSLRRLASQDKPTRRTFESLISSSSKLVDTHYWLGHAEAEGLLGGLGELKKTSELIIDEFEKALAFERRAREALAESEQRQSELLQKLAPAELKTVDAFLSGLLEITKQRGHLITLKELRAVDVARVEALEKELVARQQEVSRACVDFFLQDDAFQPLLARLDVLVSNVSAVGKASEVTPLREELASVHAGLSLLGETISGLEIDDATSRTRILDGTSSAFAQLNRARAVIEAKWKELRSHEGRAEFAVQFKLLGQSVTSALSLATTPEACDSELSKLMLELEGLEGRFGDHEEFAAELATKREEVLEAVAARRQILVEERQRRAQSVFTAAERVLSGVARRAQNFENSDELNAYFASDPMVRKVAELALELKRLGDSVRADELDSRLKSARQNAQRALRDKTDLFEEGGNVVRFGDHRFSVNTRPLELVIVQRDGGLHLHLTGTDFYEPLSDPELEQARDLWDQDLVSESTDVYRGEYLAVCVLRDAELGRAGQSLSLLAQAAREAKLEELVRDYALERLDEGYERGVHDHDAAQILEKLIALSSAAGGLRYTPDARATSWLYWQALPEDQRNLIERRASSMARLRARLGDREPQRALAGELAARLDETRKRLGLPSDLERARQAALYLVEELGESRGRFTRSAGSAELEQRLMRHLDEAGARRDFEEDLRALEAHPEERLRLARAYLGALLRDSAHAALSRYRLETAAALVAEREVRLETSSAITGATVTGLLGAHPRISSQSLTLELDEVLERITAFAEVRVPRFRAYRELRQKVAARERARLRVDEFAPRVLTSFVRNRLIDQVYLPLIGANLAKQLGAAGAKKRTDLMGLLLLVSPPGYGKTTLMEYVASRLGLVFMKVNGPALGADVHSLDPNEAPNLTARQEVEKINLGLEMGNNVMLYLDDIQHTHPELLQKFISLCDAQRRIEGVWRGRTRTYDLRGKKFCVVMAGNPYTESGARFQIPDMLANRADTYNLGDILEGKFESFALSYVENALTSNAALAPLASRDQADVYKLIAMARGEGSAPNELSQGYSAAEVGEFVALFQRLFKVQATLLRVNQEYIASASQDDKYRTEPPFKLQGSYRNMNKLAEKVVSAMNDDELERLVDDHYSSESQTLTTGAEQNLLKLAELRGRMSPEQKARWAEIKEAFSRVQRMGGKDDDPVARVTGTLGGLDLQLRGIRDTLAQAVAGAKATNDGPLEAGLKELTASLERFVRPKVEVSLSEPVNPTLELYARQLEVIERLLARDTEAPANIRALDALTHAVAELKRSLATSASPVASVAVTLAAHSSSNLYRALSSPDVCSNGGVFIATYEKAPALGTPLALTLAFPGGQPCRVSGTVAFVREAFGDDSPSGYGVRFTDVPPAARALIEEYAAHREPLLRDDG